MLVYFHLFLRLSTLFLTDEMSSPVTLEIIPVVIPGDGEERIVVFSHHQAVLPLLVVRLSVGPVKPAHGFVLLEKVLNNYLGKPSQ